MPATYEIVDHTLSEVDIDSLAATAQHLLDQTQTGAVPYRRQETYRCIGGVQPKIRVALQTRNTKVSETFSLSIQTTRMRLGQKGHAIMVVASSRLSTQPMFAPLILPPT